MRSGDRNVAQDTTLVIDHVAIAAADPLSLFNDAVEAFGAGVGGVLGERDQDCWPPRLDGFGESGGFGQLGVDRGIVEVGQWPPDFEGSCTASNMRSRSFTAQAAPISLVGS